MTSPAWLAQQRRFTFPLRQAGCHFSKLTSLQAPSSLSSSRVPSLLAQTRQSRLEQSPSKASPAGAATSTCNNGAHSTECGKLPKRRGLSAYVLPGMQGCALDLLPPASVCVERTEALTNRATQQQGGRRAAHPWLPGAALALLLPERPPPAHR